MAIQIFINSLTTGLLLALVAYGFGLIFHTTKVFHLAHAAVYGVGVFSFIALKPFLGDVLSVIGGAVVAIVVGMVIEIVVYRPLFRRNANQIIGLISSLGLNIVLVNLLALLFGNDVKTFALNSTPASFTFGSVIITAGQQYQLSISIIVLSLSYVVLKYFKINQLLRAVSDDADVSSIMGVNVERIRLMAVSMGSFLAFVAAWLVAFDVGIEPNSGMTITLSAAVVVLLTGSVGLWQIVVVSIFIAFLQNLTEWFLSAQWKEGVTFLLLLLVMFWRTEGILSYNLRKDLR